jgi:hypothetical protein
VRQELQDETGAVMSMKVRGDGGDDGREAKFLVCKKAPF